MLSSLLCFTRGIQFPPSCHRPIHFSIRNKRAHCDQKAAQAHHVLSDFEVHATSDEKIWFSYMIGTVLLLYSTKGDFKTSAFVGPNPQWWVKVGICVQTLKKCTKAVTGTLPIEKVQKPLMYHLCNQYVPFEKVLPIDGFCTFFLRVYSIDLGGNQQLYMAIFDVNHTFLSLSILDL